MAQTSYPFDGTAVTESQYSEFFRQLQDTGVVGSVATLDLKASGDSSGMNVKVQPGFAIVRGHAYQSDAVETLTIAAADASSTRNDLVVLRLDPAENSIVLAVVTGTPGAGIPSPEQTDTVVYELPLAVVQVAANATSISASVVTDRRQFTGTRVGVWTESTRPSPPRVGQLGLNATISLFEYWTGSEWVSISPTVEWTQIDNLPATFTPAAHTHAISDVNAPNGFPPASHQHDYNQIYNKPSTYTPSAHTHSWTQFTGTAPYSPLGHTHSQYLESGDAVSRANGSDRPHAHTPTGSTWYAVWVDGNHNFCRNTSSIKFKENVRDYEINPDDVLALRPVVYDRKDQVGEDGEVQPGRKDEVGLIAEQVEPHLPWLINYLDGEIDGLRYDLLGVALVPVVQRQAKQIADLEARLAVLEAAHSASPTE